MVTTIKIQEETKKMLDTLKGNRESYDETIAKLIKKIKNENLQQELKEAYISMNKEQREEFKEWEQPDL